MHNYPLHRPVRVARCTMSIPKIGDQKNKSPPVGALASLSFIPQNRCDTSVTGVKHPERASFPQVTPNPEDGLKGTAR